MKINNNLNTLRLVSAWIVLYSHAFSLAGKPTPLFLSWIPLGPLGVYVFFIISGYLVIESWQRDPNVFRFFARRVLRIFPGFVVCIGLTVFVLGPVLTTLPLYDYITSPLTRGYLENIALYISYSLPGVFALNVYPNAVNGSIWSLPIEFAMYIGIAAVGVLRGGKYAVLILALSSAAVTYFWANHATGATIFFASDLRQIFICGTYFWLGAIFYLWNLKRFFSLSNVIIAMIILLSLEPWSTWLQVAAWAFLPLLVLGFGLSYSPLFSRFTSKGDYSYGIYIYAFPVQQTVSMYFPKESVSFQIVLSSVFAIVLAVISWHVVEQPALNLKPKMPEKTS